MKSFPISYNRHKNKYGFKENNFPDTYQSDACVLDYARDPDWTVKFTYQRLNCKKWILITGFGLWMLKRRHDNVAKHDAQMRKE